MHLAPHQRADRLTQLRRRRPPRQRRQPQRSARKLDELLHERGPFCRGQAAGEPCEERRVRHDEAPHHAERVGALPSQQRVDAAPQLRQQVALLEPASLLARQVRDEALEQRAQRRRRQCKREVLDQARQ